MKKILIPSLTLGLLAKALIASNALAFTLYTNNAATNPVPSRDYATAGAVTGPNTVPSLPGYTNLFTPSNSGNNFGSAYAVPSVVKFGSTQTFGGSPTVVNSATFSGGASSTVNFTFDLQNGSHVGATDTNPIAAQGAFDRFVVAGSLTGSVGYANPFAGSSTTKITFASIKNLDDPLATSVLAMNPNNLLPALYIKATIGGQGYDIYLNQVQDISAPGAPTPLTISGYVTTSAVPEPGSVALLLGLSVTGTALLRRRKK